MTLVPSLKKELGCIELWLARCKKSLPKVQWLYIAMTGVHTITVCAFQYVFQRNTAKYYSMHVNDFYDIELRNFGP